MNQFIVSWSNSKKCWAIKNTYRWTPEGEWIEVAYSLTNNKDELLKEAKRLNKLAKKKT